MIETRTDEVKNEDSSIISTEAKKKRLSLHKIVDIYIIPFCQLITAIAVGFVAFNSYKAMEGNNQIIDTANLLSVYNTIEAKSDAYLLITDELDAFQLLHGEPNMEDTIHLTILERRQRNAIYSL
jgi:hypothetical protein